MSSSFKVDSQIASLVLTKYREYLATTDDGGDEFYAKSFSFLQTLTVADIATICEQVYASSLKREEGRHHNVAVVLTPSLSLFEEEIQGAPYHGCLNSVTAFANPLPIADLPKIAPAFEGTNQSLRIWINDKGQFEIWGFADEFLDYYGLRILPLTLGELLIDIKSLDFPSLRMLMTFAETRTVERGTPLHSLLRRGSTTAEVGSDEWHLAGHRKTRVFGFVVDIVNKMRLHGHGGTLLFIPSENVEQVMEKSIKVPIALRPRVRYTVIKKKLDKEGQESMHSRTSGTSNNSLPWSFAKEAELLGQFTAVDGATVITTDFSVIAIGAKIKESDNEDFAQRKVWVRQAFVDSEPVEKDITDTGGTRHQSAAHFVYDNRSSFAIVASQDGKLSIIYWDDELHRLCSFTRAEYSYAGLKYS